MTVRRLNGPGAVRVASVVLLCHPVRYQAEGCQSFRRSPFRIGHLADPTPPAMIKRVPCCACMHDVVQGAWRAGTGGRGARPRAAGGRRRGAPRGLRHRQLPQVAVRPARLRGAVGGGASPRPTAAASRFARPRPWLHFRLHLGRCAPAICMRERPPARQARNRAAFREQPLRHAGFGAEWSWKQGVRCMWPSETAGPETHGVANCIDGVAESVAGVWMPANEDALLSPACLPGGTHARQAMTIL